MAYEILWNGAKAVLRGKFIVINEYIKKLERLQKINIMLHIPQGPRKEKQR